MRYLELYLLERPLQMMYFILDAVTLTPQELKFLRKVRKCNPCL